MCAAQAKLLLPEVITVAEGIVQTHRPHFEQ